MHTILISRNHSQKTITKIGIYYTPCNDIFLLDSLSGTNQDSRFNLQAAAIFPGREYLREMAIEQMSELVERFPKGFDGYEDA